MTAEFSETETKIHRTARWTFVPWVCRLLGSGPLRGTSEPMPIGDADALTEDTVAALGDILNRAAWRYLAQDCGWRRLSAIHPVHDSHEAHRLWESPLPALRFTARSIDLLLAVFNATRAEQKIEDGTLPGAASANGDLLAEHLIFRRLFESGQSLGVDVKYRWNPWLANPLNALFYVNADPLPDWSPLFRDDLAPFMPWIGAELVHTWKTRADLAWRDREQFTLWFDAMDKLCASFIPAITIAARPDLLGPWLRLFSEQAEQGTQHYRRFEQLASSLPIRKRQQLAKPWVQLLGRIALLEEENARCLANHPIERTLSEKCFLALWESMDFPATMATIRKLRQQISPSFTP